MRIVNIKIENFRSIISDEVIFTDFTFFVGKNNYGKSNYLRAIDHLLSFAKTYSDINYLQYDKTKPIVIEGTFEGIQAFTPRLKESKHKSAVEGLIDSRGNIRLRLTINSDGQAETLLVNPKTDLTENVTGWSSICKSLFPETIFVLATADTADELQEKATTALSKVKKEVMYQFFTSLSVKVDDAFISIDKFLHGEDKDRSSELKELETNISTEMMGEFASVKPRIRFTMPDSSAIGKGMKIYLNDGFHDCEIEQKGNGLQRTMLFALIRLLSNHNILNNVKPAPLFLIEELEAFLHPSAQVRLAESIEKMAGKYQTIATTHSPFVLTTELLGGYRKVFRDLLKGTKNYGPQTEYPEFQKKDFDAIKSSLRHTNNLISLFADTIVIVEGKEDTGFYPSVLSLLAIPQREHISFVQTTNGGNSGFHISYNFFKLMGFSKLYIICDLDCLFNTNFKETLKIFLLDDSFIEDYRKDIEYVSTGQPSSEYVLSNIKKVNPKKLGDKVIELREKGIFVLKQGPPEEYYSDDFVLRNKNKNIKRLWESFESKDDLKNLEEIEEIMNTIIS